MTYTAIPDSAIDPDSPLTTDLMTKLRDNPIAIINGDPGAPRATSRIITPGGSAADGNCGNATDISRCGFYDFASFNLSANKQSGPICFIRVDGNSSILGATLSSINTGAGRNLFDTTLSGGVGGPGTAGGGGGGGVVGNGGVGGSGGGTGAITAADISNVFRSFMNKRPMLGSAGGYTTGGHLGGEGGGFIFLCVHGDLNLTAGAIVVDGQHFGGPGSSDVPGGGGGGGLIVVCTGTITGGLFSAKGGVGGDSGGSQKGGGGGGGYIATIASAYSGSQTYDVAGGLAYGGASVGGAGVYEKYTYTEAQINAMLLR